MEVEADSIEDARMKVDAKIYLGTLWEEQSIEVGESSLEIESIEPVE